MSIESENRRLREELSEAREQIKSASFALIQAEGFIIQIDRETGFGRFHTLPEIRKALRKLGLK